MINPKFKILTLLAVLVSAGVFAASPGRHAVLHVPQSNDLAQLAQTAKQKNLPILLVFSAQHCAYCELLEAEILRPMLISGDYNDKVIINKVMLDGNAGIRDFNGERIDASDLAQRYNVYVTPTMLFLDSNGGELEERLLGINTVEMFGGLVDHAIDASLSKLRKARQQVASKHLQGAL